MGNNRARRVAELEQLAVEEGIKLPYPAALIADAEERGHYVDLTTGYFGDERERISLTVLGDANATVMKVDNED